jgi:hypothetical protein
MKHLLLLFFVGSSIFLSCNKDNSNSPVSMTITSVDVMSYPMSNGLNSWDDSGGSPDIYLSITPGQTADTNHFVSGAINDVTSSTFTLSQGFPLQLTVLTRNGPLPLWDKDDT